MNLQKGDESWKIGGVNSGSRDLDSIRMGRQLISMGPRSKQRGLLGA